MLQPIIFCVTVLLRQEAGYLADRDFSVRSVEIPENVLLLACSANQPRRFNVLIDKSYINSQTAYVAISFALFGVIGAPIVYMMLLVTVFLILYSLAKGREISGEKIATFLAFISFLLFLVAFILSANRVQDVVYAFNYLPLLFLGPLVSYFSIGAHRQRSYRLGWLALCGVAIILIVAMVQVFILDIRRARGFQVDAIAMGQTAIILGFLAITGYFSEKGRLRFLLLLGPLLGICAALLTGSRGPVLASVPLVLIGLIFITKRPLLSVLILIVVAIAGMSALSMLWPSAFSRLETTYRVVQELFSVGDIQEYSAGRRFDMYRGAFMAFFDSPLFGHGWENKFPAVSPYLPSDWNGFEGHHHLHADLADTAVSTGMLGLIAYFIIIAVPLVGAFCSIRDTQYRVRLYQSLIVSIGYFGFGLTYLLFGYEYHTTLYIIFVAAILGYCRDEPFLRQGDHNQGL